MHRSIFVSILWLHQFSHLFLILDACHFCSLLLSSSRRHHRLHHHCHISGEIYFDCVWDQAIYLSKSSTSYMTRLDHWIWIITTYSATLHDYSVMKCTGRDYSDYGNHERPFSNTQNFQPNQSTYNILLKPTKEVGIPGPLVLCAPPGTRPIYSIYL